jgi:hypothetical protein
MPPLRPLSPRPLAPALASALALALLLSLSACTQTDVVATEAALCIHPADCHADGICPAQSCAATPDAGATSGNAPAQVGDGCSDADPGAQAFRFAVCSCDDYVSEAPLIVDGSDGPRTASGIASVGVNGSLTIGGGAQIGGALQVAGMIATGDGPDLTVAGRVLEHANPACNCVPSNLLDVPALVAAAKTSNDDAARALDPRVLDGFSGPQTLTFASGSFYLSRVAGNAPLSMQIDGNVQLYIDADPALDASWTITLAPDATLDLFIASNVRVSGTLTVGGADSVGRVRVYVGGTGTINLAMTSLIGGPLYAPTAELVTRGPLEIYGPLFVRRAAPGEEVRVHYDRSAATAVSCE